MPTAVNQRIQSALHCAQVGDASGDQGALAFDLIEGPMREAMAKTAGGQHHRPPAFETEPDERPLIREGCSILALTFVDREIFAAGAAPPLPEHGKETA